MRQICVRVRALGCKPSGSSVARHIMLVQQAVRHRPPRGSSIISVLAILELPAGERVSMHVAGTSSEDNMYVHMQSSQNPAFHHKAQCACSKPYIFSILAEASDMRADCMLAELHKGICRDWFCVRAVNLYGSCWWLIFVRRGLTHAATHSHAASANFWYRLHTCACVRACHIHACVASDAACNAGKKLVIL